MKTKKNISVGIDGITATISGCLINKEIKYPEERQTTMIHFKPKRNVTEIGIVLPRTIRENNNVGFRISDCKELSEAIQNVNRALRKIIHRDWSELYVTQVEVACTVDLGIVDKTTIDLVLDFLNRVMLQEDRMNNNLKRKNAVKSRPTVKYVTGEKRRGCVFINDEITKSLNTDLWSNRRLRFKVYSKGAYSKFGGDTSILRIEGIYCQKGIEHILKQKDNYITLKHVLTQKAVKSFVNQFKVDYSEIVAPNVNGFLNESETEIYRALKKTSAWNVLQSYKGDIYDMSTYENALRKHYNDKNSSDGAYRKKLYDIRKKMNDEGMPYSRSVIKMLKDIERTMNIETLRKK